MTVVPETREFIGSVFDLRRLEADYDVLQADRLVDTFPRWKRALSWCLWRTPLRRVWQRRFLSPYGAVRAILRLRSSSGTESEERIRAQADDVLARDSLSRERPAPEHHSRDGVS